MRSQRLDRAVFPRQFCLGQAGVNLFVANLMQQHRWPVLATPEPRDQVVQALRDLRRDRAGAKGANRVWHSVFLEFQGLMRQENDVSFEFLKGFDGGSHKIVGTGPGLF